MKSQLVPASTKVRASRVRFVDTDRLARRLAWLNENKASLARGFDGRKPLRELAREIHTVQVELARRA